ncbi:MAG TPA: HAMP domain-containing sensor histidine kinase, partial [Candidatus Binatia bacterium]
KWVVQTRRPLAISDVDLVDDPPIGQTARRTGIRGYLAVPFFSRRGEVVGILRALSYHPRAFLPEEMDLLQQMTNGAAIALENAQLLEQTKQQADALQQADKVKNEFLGFVSHELRTPVNIIMGYSALLQGGMCGEMSEEQDQMLEKVSVNSRQLLSMIDQLLEATKIEAGAVKADLQEISLSDFLEEIRTVYSAPMAGEIDLVWDFPAGLPTVITDGEKLRHILQNLVGNALKYTEKGAVTLSARQLGDGGEIEFRVADTGIGISEKELPHIFEMFSQVSAARPKSGGGVGLGLHIVKKFTELLGGTIGVTSRQGAGSTFTLKIPGAAAATPKAAHGKYSPSGPAVL